MKISDSDIVTVTDWRCTYASSGCGLRTRGMGVVTLIRFLVWPLMYVFSTIDRFKPVPSNPLDDPISDYMNLLGMVLSMCGLMMKVRCPVLCTV